MSRNVVQLNSLRKLYTTAKPLIQKAKIIMHQSMSIPATKSAFSDPINFLPTPSLNVYAHAYEVKYPLRDAPKIKFHDLGDFGQNTEFRDFRIEGSHELPIKHTLKKGVEISNFAFPYGSIGIKTKQDETIYTQKIFQCAGLAIYDSKEKTQSLTHIFDKTPYYKVKEGLLKMISPEAFKEPGRLKISIVNGRDIESEDTVNKLLGVIHLINPDSAKDVHFRHFPNSQNAVLCMQNGELFAAAQANVSEINPDRITSFY